ncbi:Serum paraoxonase/arylesterase 1 [Pseudocercospora fuligena]|uniref:Serum paraoxonase/arylesterase 1 n=1 Tax=Pseudocercospora fuligena TaxID=685502 RepID=A0A8H6VCP7_9PEZI|nr:Serum paraoxonase/arylesterase 1 [Pseudocercospora fuligena]
MLTLKISAAEEERFAIILSSIIYARYNILQTFYTNHPSRFTSENNINDFRILHKKSIRNCEDIYLSQDHGYALLSCDPGRDSWNTVMGTFINPSAPERTGIYIYRYAEDPDSKPEKLSIFPLNNNASEFHPLGIDLHEESRSLFVVNHAANGSRIDMFKFNAKGAYLTVMGSIVDPEHLPSPNSIAVISENEFFVTNDHFWTARKNPWLSKFETYAGLPGGTVAYMKTEGDLEKDEGVAKGATLAKVPFANGIVLLNESTLAVSSSSHAEIRLFGILRNGTRSVPRLELRKRVKVPFIPDNLSVDSKGRLLVAGHPHAPTVEKTQWRNGACEVSKSLSEMEYCKFPRLSWIVEWGEEDGVKTLYKGSEFGTSTTAVRDWERGVGFAVGLYERGMLAWKT